MTYINSSENVIVHWFTNDELCHVAGPRMCLGAGFAQVRCTHQS